MSDINKTLKERGNTHGDFRQQSIVAQSLKYTARQGPRWSEMEPFQTEAIEMILHKIARITSGDPYFLDSWRDIIGYAQLALSELENHPRSTDVKMERFSISSQKQA